MHIGSVRPLPGVDRAARTAVIILRIREGFVADYLIDYSGGQAAVYLWDVEDTSETAVFAVQFEPDGSGLLIDLRDETVLEQNI